MQARYSYLGHIGRGGFGRVCLYYDNSLNRKVVVKALIAPTPENCERLIREGRILLELKSELHIIDLLDYSFDPHRPYLVLPYYEHGTLRSLVGRTNWLDAISIIQNLAVALRSVHLLGGIHRDVKPDNCFLDRIAGSKLVRLGDFGFGRIPAPFTGGEITRHAFGTPGYIAPELFRGVQYSTACDIFSLGITGIELITGSTNRRSIETAWFVNSEARALLLAMTSSNPSHRPSAADLVARARRIVVDSQESAKSFLAGAAVCALGLIALKQFSK